MTAAIPDLDFQRLFSSAPDMLLALLPNDPVYTIVAATECYLQATGTSGDVIGQGLFETFPDNPDDPSADGVSNLRASLQRVLATKAADTMAVQKYDIRRVDGSFEVRYWSPKNLPVFDAAGDILYILHRVVDVTEMVQASELHKEMHDRNNAMQQEVIMRSRELAAANAELRDANVQLGKLDQAKSAFFSNISHEFRTPLTLMLGPLEDALADTANPLPATQRERLQLANGNALRLLKLVNSLLDFSRLEAGRLQPHFAPLNISRFTAELAGMFQSAAQKAGVQLNIDCPPVSAPVWVDRDMWEKIVPNLISNALKFTLHGAIDVRIREQDDHVVLEVADTGIGIPTDEQAKIFDRFHQVSHGNARTQEGTGIGLSLVRDLTELHGGTVSVESELQHGSVFRISIPTGYAHLPTHAVALQPVDPRVGRNAAAHVAEAVRWGDRQGIEHSTTATGDVQGQVLVVDDNADLRQYLSNLLQPMYEVTTATDGMSALEALQTRPPDLVISDVMMPKLDGFGLVQKLRSNPDTASIPVILLSARAGEDSAIDGLDAGADDYLAKPFSARELLARIRTHIQLARTRRAWIAELQRANDELDAFSYSVSHDLRAPLRAIRGFAQALSEDCNEQLNKQGHSYLSSIHAGVQRMSTLIDALLDLARITRGAIAHDKVNLSTLARDITADLRHSNSQRKVTVTIHHGLHARGDRNLLNVVLVNLIGNAWKFTAHREHAAITVGCTEAEVATFFVRDNGAGFDMQQAGQLFTPFRRLHRDSDFEGTGIGLATVQRIIERHGGKIWAEAAVDQGACFYFSLPGNNHKNELPARRVTD